MSLSRREFIRNLSIAGSGLTLGFSLPLAATDSEAAATLQPNAFLRIDNDGKVTVQIHKAEMGQGVLTGIITIIAEELEVDPAAVHYEMAKVDKAFSDPEYQLQITGGSNAIRVYYDILRQAGASARDMLLQAASQHSGLPRRELVAADGRISDSSGKVDLGYGDLVAAASTLPVPKEPALKQAADFTRIGKQNRRLDIQPKVDGSPIFGIDAPVPDALVAVLLHCPHFGGRLLRADTSRAEAMPGVEHVVIVEAGVAVVAKNYWRARKAAEVVDVEWQQGEHPLQSSTEIEAALTAAFEEGDFREVRSEGKAPKEPVGTVLEAEYNLPFLAHATMEPMNATVVPGNGRADLWVGSQSPDVDRAFAAQALGLDPDDVTVHNCFLGGGFGRRAAGDCSYQAAQIAAAIGKPVKLVWSREDDMRQDFYRPAMKSRLQAQVAEDGSVRSWQHNIAGPSVMQYTMPQFAPAMMPGWVPDFLVNLAADFVGNRDWNSWEGAKELPYGFDHIDVGYRNVETPVPLGFWRSVGHSHNAFVVESFIDELAHAAGEDPVAFRRRWLPEDSRHRQVLDSVAELSDWGNAPAGHFQGVAVHESFHSVVAEVVEISLRGGQPKLEKAFCAIHCGQVINPDIVRAQMEGGMLFGLTAALHGEITLQDGAIQQSNFHDYPMLRMNEVPEVSVAIIDSDAAPTGVGEPATPPAAPALGNAVFAATGQRLRDLPFKLG